MKKLFLILSFMVLCSPAFAASKYWVGGGSSTNWSATSSTNWSNTDGGPNNATVPAAGDDVFLKSSANCVMNTNSNALKSFDMTGYTGTFSGSSNVVVRGADSTTVAIKFAGTVTWTGLVSITTGGTARVYNLTSGGNALTDLTMNAAGGTLSLQDTWNGSSTFTLTNGIVNTNGNTMTFSDFSSSNGNTRTFNFTSSIINVSGTGTIWANANTTNLTITSTSSTVNITNTSSSNKTIQVGSGTDGGAIHFNNMDISGTGTGTVIFTTGATNPLTLDGNLTIHPPKTVRITASGTKNVIVTGTFTATGTSGNLITLNSVTAGTSVNWTLNGTVTADYLSLKDVTNNGSSSASFIGNNSTSVSNVIGFYSKKTISAAGGNYNATTAWTEGIVPTVIDTVIATSGSGNLTINVASNCFAFDLTSYVGTLTDAGNTLTLNASGGGTHVFKLAGTLAGGNLQVIFANGSGTTVNVTTAGKTLSSFQVTGAGTVSLQDALDNSLGTLTISAGTFNTNGYSVTASGFYNSAAATINISSSSVTSNTTGFTTFAINSGTTFTGTGSNIYLTDTSASSKTFDGGGKTYNILNITGGGAGAILFLGANTFSKFPQVSGGTKILTWPAGVTTTIVDGTTGFGNSTNLLTLTSSTPTSAYTFTTAGGTVSCDYLNLTDSTAAGTVPFYAGTHSTNTSNNTNWTFTAPPAGGVVKTINGLAYASVKTINGLAAASVKEYNGAATQ